jgi:hypothetical protein
MTCSKTILVLIQATCALQVSLLGLKYIERGMSHDVSLRNITPSVKPDTRPVIALDLDDVLSATNAVAAQCMQYGSSYHYLGA